MSIDSIRRVHFFLLENRHIVQRNFSDMKFGGGGVSFYGLCPHFGTSRTELANPSFQNILNFKGYF